MYFLDSWKLTNNDTELNDQIEKNKKRHKDTNEQTEAITKQLGMLLLLITRITCITLALALLTLLALRHAVQGCARSYAKFSGLDITLLLALLALLAFPNSMHSSRLQHIRANIGFRG